jgi:DNA-directed RNA polymerase omega subunit
MSNFYYDDLKDKYPNKFELIIAAAKRSRDMPIAITRAEGKIIKKRTTAAIEDIRVGNVTTDELKERSISQYQQKKSDKDNDK